MSDLNDDPEGELRAIERRRLQALVEGDQETARELHSDDYQLVTPSGNTYSKDEYLGDIAAGTMEYRVFEPASAIAVQILGDGAAVRYKVRIDIRFAGGGDSGTFWHTDLYRRTDGRWQAVWSQATRIREGP